MESIRSGRGPGFTEGYFEDPKVTNQFSKTMPQRQRRGVIVNGFAIHGIFDIERRTTLVNQKMFKEFVVEAKDEVEARVGQRVIANLVCGPEVDVRIIRLDETNKYCQEIAFLHHDLELDGVQD